MMRREATLFATVVSQLILLLFNHTLHIKEPFSSSLIFMYFYGHWGSVSSVISVCFFIHQASLTELHMYLNVLSNFLICYLCNISSFDSIWNFLCQAISGLVGEDSAFGAGGAVSAHIDSSYIINLRDLDMKHVKDFIFINGEKETILCLNHFVSQVKLCVCYSHSFC